MKRICLQRVYIGNIEPQSKAFPLCKSKVESKSNLPEGRENLYRIWRRINSVWFPTSHYHLILRSYALFLLNNTFYVFYWIMYQNPEVCRIAWLKNLETVLLSNVFIKIRFTLLIVFKLKTSRFEGLLMMYKFMLCIISI